ncbi:MAG: hypothetical protein IKY76_04840, partial [Alistipes sp.]|nr:hypothetical protein [Alistipes sp.]
CYTSKSKNHLKNLFAYFRSGKWCKDKASFSNHQIFQELFATFFLSFFFFIGFEACTSRPFVESLRTYFLIADAKVGIIFIPASIL